MNVKLDKRAAQNPLVLQGTQHLNVYNDKKWKHSQPYLYNFFTSETEQCADTSAAERTVSGNISVRPHNLSTSVSSILGG